jgi:ketosteroid isomerase-like protein
MAMQRTRQNSEEDLPMTLRKTVMQLAAIATLAAPALAPAADESARIRAGTKSWVESFNLGNAGAVVALYTHDAVLMPPGAPLARGTAAIKEAIAKEIAGTKKAGLTFAMGSVDEVGMSGDMAWHMGTYVVKDKAGKAVDAGKFLEVWQKKDGKWRMVRDIWNSDGGAAAPAAAPAAPAPSPPKK